MALDNWLYLSEGGDGPPYGELAYTEYEESGSGSINDNESEHEIIYQVDDENRLTFLDDLMGYATFGDENLGDYTITRVLPEEHPEFQECFASGAKWKRIGKPTTALVKSKTVGRWTISRIEAAFKPPEYAVVADEDLPSMTYTDPFSGATHKVPDETQRFVTYKYNYVIQQLTVQGLMQFVTRVTNKALDTAPGFATVYLEKEVTWHQVPARTVEYDFWVPPNQATVLKLGGTLNQTAFLDHPPGTVLFVGYQPRLRRPNLSSGLYTWDITYRFLVKDDGIINVGDGNESIGPNFIYDTLFERYDLITSDGTKDGSPIYEESDLNALFAFTANS